MRKNKQQEQYQQWISEICPQAINSMRDLLGDPSTPVNAKVTLIGMILDRTLGKAETPVRVTTDQDSIDTAEEQLMAIVNELNPEFQTHDPETEMAAEDKKEQ